MLEFGLLTLQSAVLLERFGWVFMGFLGEVVSREASPTLILVLTYLDGLFCVVLLPDTGLTAVWECLFWL